MEGNNRPLALNSWVDATGENSYIAAINAVNDALDPEHSVFLQEHPELLNFMKNSLYDRIASQSQENYTQYGLVAPLLNEKHIDFIRGDKSPDELTLFLFVTSRLQSIETARRTSRKWNMYNEIDRPVRDSLDQNPFLHTENLKSAPLYRIKNLNIVDRTNGNDSPDSFFVQVDRKRTVRQHFGGKVLTIVRNSYVLHDINKAMPEDVRQLIRDQREMALDPSLREIEQDYDYDQHLELLKNYLEPAVTQRSTSEQPTWAAPIATGYYAARRKYVKTMQLLPSTDDRA